jgi:hypothetical protein
MLPAKRTLFPSIFLPKIMPAPGAAKKAENLFL